MLCQVLITKWRVSFSGFLTKWRVSISVFITKWRVRRRCFVGHVPAPHPPTTTARTFSRPFISAFSAGSSPPWPMNLVRWTTMSGSSFSHLHDEHGGRTVRVRGAVKVALHLAFGVLVIAVEQAFRLLEWRPVRKRACHPTARGRIGRAMRGPRHVRIPPGNAGKRDGAALSDRAKPRGRGKEAQRAVGDGLTAAAFPARRGFARASLEYTGA